jgi:hypothetical protein
MGIRKGTNEVGNEKNMNRGHGSKNTIGIE